MEEVPIQPPPPERRDPLVRAIRGLTAALWVVAIAVFLQIGYYVFVSTVSMKRVLKNVTANLNKQAAEEAASHVSSSSYVPESFEGKQFNELTNEKKIKYASVILLTKHVKDAKGKAKSVISEIVKQKPGTELHYKVGEKFAPYGSMPMNEACTGDGEIVLMVGSPADMREASSYTGDRLDSMGGMTLADLRELAKQDGK